jgi:hypothetical protein
MYPCSGRFFGFFLLVFGWGTEWVEGIFVIVLLRNFLGLFLIMAEWEFFFEFSCFPVELPIGLFELLLFCNRVYRVVFELPGSQSGRVRVTCFDPINNRVGSPELPSLLETLQLQTTLDGK